MIHRNHTYEKCNMVCGMPCEEIAYDLKVIGFSTENGSDNEIKDKFTLLLSFASDAEEITKYVPALTYTEFVAYVGAYIGTWTGMSLLDTLLRFENCYNLLRKLLKQTVRARNDS
ncbi:uncharacterized protein LOC111270260 [Varroa jacobsoni]|uniref:uncharacterized protein LOC111270260 n=1 Tax=Varroa jacobsoni TaxID=62625 RepID=UPI000BF6AC80|nr:uncharacterized protein LOC111270260 [Varroa jacobsoni]